MKKSQNTRTYVGKELKSLIDKKGNAIIKAEALKNVKAIKVVSEVAMTDSQFDILMNSIGDIKSEITDIKNDLVNIKKDIKELKTDVKQLKTDVKQLKIDVEAMKNTPTMKRELQATY